MKVKEFEEKFKHSTTEMNNPGDGDHGPCSPICEFQVQGCGECQTGCQTCQCYREGCESCQRSCQRHCQCSKENNMQPKLGQATNVQVKVKGNTATITFEKGVKAEETILGLEWGIGKDKKSATKTTKGTSFHVNGLEYKTLYGFGLKSKNKAEETNWLTKDNFFFITEKKPIPPGPQNPKPQNPSNPTIKRIESLANSTAKVYISTGDNTESLEIQARLSGSNQWRSLLTSSSSSNKEEERSIALEEEKTYDIRVRALNNSYSTESEFVYYNNFTMLIVPTGNVYLQFDDSNDKVKILQRDLKALGYFKYPEITGNYLSITQSAVIDFERANKFKDDGKVYLRTIKKITEKLLESGYAYKEGNQSGKIRDIQEKLHSLGYYDGELNGGYNDATVEAVVNFQKSSCFQSIIDFYNETSRLGVLDLTTIKRIDEEYDKLCLNMSEYEIKQLQRKLEMIGYGNLFTGYYDILTQNAIKSFFINHNEYGIKGSGLSIPFKFHQDYDYYINHQCEKQIRYLQISLNQLDYSLEITEKYDQATEKALDDCKRRLNIIENSSIIEIIEKINEKIKEQMKDDNSDDDVETKGEIYFSAIKELIDNKGYIELIKLGYNKATGKNKIKFDEAIEYYLSEYEADLTHYQKNLIYESLEFANSRKGRNQIWVRTDDHKDLSEDLYFISHQAVCSILMRKSKFWSNILDWLENHNMGDVDYEKLGDIRKKCIEILEENDDTFTGQTDMWLMMKKCRQILQSGEKLYDSQKVDLNNIINHYERIEDTSIVEKGKCYFELLKVLSNTEMYRKIDVTSYVLDAFLLFEGGRGAVGLGKWAMKEGCKIIAKKIGNKVVRKAVKSSVFLIGGYVFAHGRFTEIESLGNLLKYGKVPVFRDLDGSLNLIKNFYIRVSTDGEDMYNTVDMLISCADLGKITCEELQDLSRLVNNVKIKQISTKGTGVIKAWRGNWEEIIEGIKDGIVKEQQVEDGFKFLIDGQEKGYIYFDKRKLAELMEGKFLDMRTIDSYLENESTSEISPKQPSNIKEIVSGNRVKITFKKGEGSKGTWITPLWDLTQKRFTDKEELEFSGLKEGEIYRYEMVSESQSKLPSKKVEREFKVESYSPHNKGCNSNKQDTIYTPCIAKGEAMCQVNGEFR